MCDGFFLVMGLPGPGPRGTVLGAHWKGSASEWTLVRSALAGERWWASGGLGMHSMCATPGLAPAESPCSSSAIFLCMLWAAQDFYVEFLSRAPAGSCCWHEIRP